MYIGLGSVKHSVCERLLTLCARDFPGLRQTVYALPTMQSFYDIAAGRAILPQEKFKRTLVYDVKLIVRE